MKLNKLSQLFLLVTFCGILYILYLFFQSNNKTNLFSSYSSFYFDNRDAVTWSLHQRNDSQNDSSQKCNYAASGPRVLCAVLTHYGNLAAKAAAVNATWGKRCDKTIYVIGNNAEKKTQLESTLNVVHLNIKEQYHNLTYKMLETFKYIDEHMLDEFDWFLKADDDTYVVVENLKYFLANRCPNEKFTYGYNFDISGVAYHSGGGGYLLNRETIENLARELKLNASFCAMPEGYEDMEISRCLRKLNVTPGESRDRLGRERFHCVRFSEHWDGSKKWIETYSKNKVKYVNRRESFGLKINGLF
jgi:glycoprotein-N-acetylgalactosamine 3-beta-galactosyltransferase